MNKTRFPLSVEVDKQDNVVAYEVEVRVRAIDSLRQVSLWSRPSTLMVEVTHE